VVLGGIYALERIARSSQKDKGPILEVFCAYVRHNAPWPPEDPAQAQKRRPWTRKGRKIVNPAQAGKPMTGQPEQGQTATNEETRPEPDTDIQAVLTVIGRLGPAREGQGKPNPLDLARTDLRGANLWRAHLERAKLESAHMEDANLLDAHLERAKLENAHLEGANLRDIHLQHAFLQGAHLEGASLVDAVLEGAYLNAAHLEGADLRYTSGLTQAQIDQAYCDDKTKLPPGLKRSKKQKPSP
jgi:hypothetical protein